MSLEEHYFYVTETDIVDGVLKPTVPEGTVYVAGYGQQGGEWKALIKTAEEVPVVGGVVRHQTESSIMNAASNLGLHGVSVINVWSL